MSTQLATQSQQLTHVLRNSLYPGASDASIALVVAYCHAAGLDPLQKPVHIVPMWSKAQGGMQDVIMPGIGLYRTQAARTKQLAGISEPEFGPMFVHVLDGVTVTYPEWCAVTVLRQLDSGHVAKFTAVEYWLENYAEKGGKEKSIAPNAMWAKRPRGQLAKCAEAQALRKGFPEVGAAPTADEMEGKAIESGEVEQSVTPKPTAQSTRPTWPDENFSRNLPTWRKAIESGQKTAAEVIAMVETKGVLMPSQRAAIESCAVIEGEVVEVAL